MEKTKLSFSACSCNVSKLVVFFQYGNRRVDNLIEFVIRKLYFVPHYLSLS